MLGFCVSAGAQVVYPDSYLVDYQKVMELQNKDFRKRIFITPSGTSVFEIDSLPQWNAWGGNFPMYRSAKKSFNILPVVSSLSYNSKYPRGYNDGAVWKGKGMNADLNFGFKGNLGIFHYTFAPVVYFAQNMDYDLLPGTVNPNYGYPFNRRIDWVQRYGDGAVARFHMGQSDLRVIYKKMTLGLSTQNVVFGGAQFNPIVMSNNAGMFPHIDLGTDTPIETPIGDFEIRSYWGMMQESDYFDDKPRNDTRYFQGGGAYYRPSFLPGFSLGMSRVHYRDWKIQKFEFGDIFVSLADFSSNQDTLANGSVVNDVYDQMVSANFKWIFEEVGFETYLEIAKNDFSNVRTLSTEPEHSRAYTIGFIKVFDLGASRAVKTAYEHTTLGQSRLIQLRFSPPYYTHHLAPQGYTHQGQVLGAGIGTGANGDIGVVNYYFPKGMYGFSLQRIRFNDDYAFAAFDSNGDRLFDVEYTFALSAVRFAGDFTFAGEAALSHRLNWQYISDNDVTNLYLRFVVGYHLVK